MRGSAEGIGRDPAREMSEQAETGASALDTAKLVASVAILVGGIVAFYLLGDLPIAVRWLIVLGSFAAGIVVALQSTQGRELWQFVQGSRVELRKVVWPTRQETLQTTMVVMVAIVLMGVFFWLLDMALGAITRVLTGQGG
jgi:preprotein translocase subunit SecE